MASAEHAAHGSAPETLLNVDPAVHAALHTVSAVGVHADLTPAAHVASPAQAPHGFLPVAALKVEPVWQSPGAALQIVSAVAVQAACTPRAHVAAAAQSVHGAAPVATLKVEPAAHAGAPLHVVSVVAVQAVCTPYVHVAHAAHGASPVATLNVAPTVHEVSTGGAMFGVHESPEYPGKHVQMLFPLHAPCPLHGSPLHGLGPVAPLHAQRRRPPVFQSSVASHVSVSLVGGGGAAGCTKSAGHPADHVPLWTEYVWVP